MGTAFVCGRRLAEGTTGPSLVSLFGQQGRQFEGYKLRAIMLRVSDFIARQLGRCSASAWQLQGGACFSQGHTSRHCVSGHGVQRSMSNFMKALPPPRTRTCATGM